MFDQTPLLFYCYTRWTTNGVHEFSHSWMPFWKRPSAFFPTLGARLLTPTPGSHNTPNKKLESGTYRISSLLQLSIFFTLMVVINLTPIWQHFCSHVIHAGQPLVFTDFHTVDWPFWFNPTSLHLVINHSFGHTWRDRITLNIRSFFLNMVYLLSEPFYH